MSRCFPFPPPGYEKKPTTDDLDLLKKEKRKEKKHKKDKKDKEKKEGKEKREKDRSEGKHKEKKDKKDKHRDKKKDKEKGKTSTQDEGYNGEKHNQQIQQIQDKKQSLQFRNGESNKDRTSFSDDKKQLTQFQGQNGDLARNRDTENFKFVQELDRRIRDEEKGSGSHQFFVEGRKNSYNNKVEMQNAIARNKINGATATPPPQPPLPPPPQPPLDHKIERRFDQKEKVQESDDRRGDKRKHKDREKQRAGKEKEKDNEKEKSKEKSERKHMKKSDLPMATLNNLFENNFQGVGSEGILKKRKEMETNGVSHENEPRPNKMARPISNISPENGRPQNQNPSSSFLDNQREKASQNNFKMGGGKSQKVNGIIPPPSPPVSVSLPAKKPSIPAFNHLHYKPSPIKSPPVAPPVITNTNHVTAQSPPVTATKPPPPPPTIPIPIPIPIPSKQPVSHPKPPPVVKAAAPPLPPPKKKAETVKPPHPDTKYLNQILTVPKPEEWGGVDDQEWLFNTAAPPPPLLRAAAATMADVQVWSEAKHIESVDVCALPYVIPY